MKESDIIIDKWKWKCGRCGTIIGSDYRQCAMCLLYKGDLKGIKKNKKRANYGLSRYQIKER